MRLKPKALFTLFYVLFFVAVIGMSFGYNRKARLIPLVVAVPCLAMAVGQFFVDLRKGKKARGASIEDDLFHNVMGKIHADIPVADAPKEEKRKRELVPFWTILGWILAFYASVYLLGFMITIPLFTVAYMRLNEERWTTALASAAGLWGLIYVSFSVVAKIALHEGLLFTLLSAQ